MNRRPASRATPGLRLMRSADLPAVLAIQLGCYPAETIESADVFRERLTQAPQTSWVAEDEAGVCAYLVAYRSRVGKLTPLGGDFVIADDPDCLYLHDLALLPGRRGGGLATALVRQAWRHAVEHRLAYSALVSVNGSQAFWGGLGYAAWDLPEAAQRRHLDSYPGEARYLVKRLAPPVPETA